MPKPNLDPKLTAIQASPDGTVEAVLYEGQTYRVRRDKDTVTLKTIRGDELRIVEPGKPGQRAVADMKLKE